MGRMYAAVFEKVSVSTAEDLIEIVAPSDGAVIIHRVVITQSESETSEQLSFLIHRGSTSGSGGSSVTPNPLLPDDGAFGGTVEANNGTQGTEGLFVHAEGVNMLTGFDFHPTPECRPVIKASGRLIVELQDAPAAALIMSGTMIFEDIS